MGARGIAHRSADRIALGRPHGRETAGGSADCAPTSFAASRGALGCGYPASQGPPHPRPIRGRYGAAARSRPRRRPRRRRGPSPPRGANCGPMEANRGPRPLHPDSGARGRPDRQRPDTGRARPAGAPASSRGRCGHPARHRSARRYRRPRDRPAIAPRVQSATQSQRAMHHGAAHDPRQQLLRHLSAGFRFSVQRAHRWRGRQPRVRERRLRLAARIRCIEQHLGALSRQVRRSAANARSRQRHVPAAGLALPHVRYPVGELWHPGHRPDRPHALHLDRGAAKGQRLQGQRFYHRRALATTGRSRHRRHSGGDTPLLLHG